jgi:hypothetical protein
MVAAKENASGERYRKGIPFAYWSPWRRSKIAGLIEPRPMISKISSFWLCRLFWLCYVVLKAGRTSSSLPTVVETMSWRETGDSPHTIGL